MINYVSNTFASLSTVPNDTQVNCTICQSSLLKAYELDSTGARFKGRAVKLACCDNYLHAQCLMKHLENRNDTPANYGNDNESLLADLRRAGVSLDTLYQENAIDNAPVIRRCPACNQEAKQFICDFYNDQPDNQPDNQPKKPQPLAQLASLANEQDDKLGKFNEDDINTMNKEFNGPKLNEEGMKQLAIMLSCMRSEDIDKPPSSEGGTLDTMNSALHGDEEHCLARETGSSSDDLQQGDIAAVAPRSLPQVEDELDDYAVAASTNANGGGRAEGTEFSRMAKIIIQSLDHLKRDLVIKMYQQCKTSGEDNFSHEVSKLAAIHYFIKELTPHEQEILKERFESVLDSLVTDEQHSFDNDLKVIKEFISRVDKTIEDGCSIEMKQAEMEKHREYLEEEAISKELIDYCFLQENERLSQKF